jgi:hypothetical protein
MKRIFLLILFCTLVFNEVSEAKLPDYCFVNNDISLENVGNDNPFIADLISFPYFTPTNQIILGIVTSMPDAQFSWQSSCSTSINQGVLSPIDPIYYDDAIFAASSPDLFRVFTVYTTGYYEVTVWPSEFGSPVGPYSFSRIFYMIASDVIPPQYDHP